MNLKYPSLQWDFVEGAAGHPCVEVPVRSGENRGGSYENPAHSSLDEDGRLAA